MADTELPGVWLLDAFRRGGVDARRLSERAPEQVDRLLRDPAGLDPDDLNRILIECAALSGNTSFGLHMTRFVDVSMLGTFGYLLLNAPTVGGFLEIAERYYPIFYRGARLVVSTDARCVQLGYGPAQPSNLSPRHDNEWTLGFFVEFIRDRVGEDWFPIRTTFANEAPRGLSELRRVFGGEILFNQPSTMIEFDRALLDHRINESDPRLLEILRGQAEALLGGIETPSSLESEVRLQILEQLERGAAKAAVIARRMAMSLSTFKRRLQRESLQFRALRDSVIRDVATRSLLETDLEIGDIAHKLGYSETSAFHRSFVRIVGQTPAQYRRSGPSVRPAP